MKGPRLCGRCKACQPGGGWQRFFCPEHGDLPTLMTVITVKGHRDKIYQPIRPDECKDQVSDEQGLRGQGLKMKKACRWIGVIGTLTSVAAAGFGLKALGSGWIWAATFCFSQAIHMIGRLP